MTMMAPEKGRDDASTVERREEELKPTPAEEARNVLRMFVAVELGIARRNSKARPDWSGFEERLGKVVATAKAEVANV